jgi:conjugal transfer ATP-binding protein TraC
MPIVQDPQDLDTPSGRVMLVNTATKVILPLDRAGQADLQRYVRLNERELELVRNLRLVKRRYSEFFISIDGMQSAKGLLIPDPLRYAVATTDPVDEERIERHFLECGDMLAAVQRFARESPYGLRAAHAAHTAHAPHAVDVARAAYSAYAAYAAPARAGQGEPG